MEAQPLALAVVFLTVLVGGAPTDAPLSVGEILLILLGFLWWALALAYAQGREIFRSTSLRTALRLCSLFVAWGVLSWPFLMHLSDLASGPRAFLLGAELLFALWLWRRSLGRARLGFAYEPLSTTFKIGLGALLFIMLFVLLIPQAQQILPMLESSLTIFFFSGLITLSLARLGTLRQVRLASGRQADPTRAWLGALTLFSSLLIALVFLLEAVFSYTSFLWVLHALQPVWDALGTVVGWLLFLIVIVLTPFLDLASWLIGLLRSGGAKPQAPISSPINPLTRLNPRQLVQLPPELLIVGRWLVLGIAVLALLLLVRASIRRWFLPYDTEQIEETREHLERLAPQREPRSARKKRRTNDARAIGPLDSARAYYRLLLHTVARTRPELAHQQDETPLEYEQRLRGQVETLLAEQVQAAQPQPPETSVLQTLTREYMAERYGQQPPSAAQQSYLRRWMPHLLRTIENRSRPAEQATGAASSHSQKEQDP